MKAFGFLIIFFTSIYSSFGQHYFNDVVSNEYSNKLYQLLRSEKIKKISVKNYDAENNVSEGFSLEQEFDESWMKLTTVSSTITGSKSLLTTTYRNNKVSSTEELAKGVSTKTQYNYDEKGKLKSINSTTTDTALKYQASEKHLWEYQNDKPTRMLRIKNNSDTTFIEFIKDDKNNIAEEHWKYKGKELEVYYYYYNAQNKLTDVVRFNQRVKKLLPDYIFEFDAKGNLSQMTQVPAGNSNYIVWKYNYDDRGLKQSENCFNKQKELIGKVEYTYIK